MIVQCSKLFSIFFSENFLVPWTKKGVPKDIDMLNNFRVVFTVSGKILHLTCPIIYLAIFLVHSVIVYNGN